MDLGHEKSSSINFLERCVKHPFLQVPSALERSLLPPLLSNLTNIFIKFLLKPWKGKIFPAVKALTCRLVFFSDF